MQTQTVDLFGRRGLGGKGGGEAASLFLPPLIYSYRERRGSRGEGRGEVVKKALPPLLGGAGAEAGAVSALTPKL
jgi:hypothetical protein